MATWHNGETIQSDKLNAIENAITAASELSKDEVELIANKVENMEGLSVNERNKYPSVNALLAYIDDNLQDATYKQY